MRDDRRHVSSRLPNLSTLAAKLRSFARERRALPLLYIEFSDSARAKGPKARTRLAAYKQATAAALKASIGSVLRKDDLVAAGAGGQWFIALLTARALASRPQTSDPDLGIAAERLRRAVQLALAQETGKGERLSSSRFRERVTVRCGWNVLDLVERDLPLEALRHAVRGAALVARVEEQRATVLASVTHELRTPLTAIIGFAERMQAQPLSAARRKRYLDIITDESRRLHRLAEGLIDVGSWTSGNLKLRPAHHELARIARKAAEAVADRAMRKQVAVTIAGEATGFVDPDRCLQILINLLDNAVRYSPEGGRVDVVLRRRGQSCALEVKDEGPGFTPSSRRSAGRPFASGQGGKVGLGLAISSLLVEAHGGTLAIENSRRGGRVSVTLPGVKARK